MNDTPSAIHADQLVIPLAFVEGLRAKKATLMNGIATMQKELEVVNQQLSAVEILQGSGGAAIPSTTQTSLFEADDAAGPTLLDLIIQIVNDSAGPMLPKEIRDEVKALGHGDLLSSTNYIYTALGRAVSRGLIDKQGDYYLPARHAGKAIF